MASPTGTSVLTRPLIGGFGPLLSRGCRAARMRRMRVAPGRAAGCRDGDGLIVDNVATCGYIGGMKSVGVRELKNRLSEYLREVRAGERVLVTDRGEVVAELAPPGQGTHESDVPAALATLARRGLATLGAPGDRSLYPRLARRRRRRLTALQLLDEERGSR